MKKLWSIWRNRELKQLIFTGTVYYMINRTRGDEPDKALIFARDSRNATTTAIEGRVDITLNTRNMAALKNITTHRRRIVIANFSSIPATTIIVKYCLMK